MHDRRADALRDRPILFADDRATLERARAFITAWLADERHLRLKHPLAPILSTANPIDVLGHRITRDGLAPRPRILRRLRRRVTAALLGRAPRDPRAVRRRAGGWRCGA